MHFTDFGQRVGLLIRFLPGVCSWIRKIVSSLVIAFNCCLKAIALPMIVAVLEAVIVAMAAIHSAVRIHWRLKQQVDLAITLASNSGPDRGAFIYTLNLV